MPRSLELRRLHSNHVAAMTAIHADAGNEPLTAEQQTAFDTAETAAAALLPQIAEAERVEALAAEANRVVPAAARSATVSAPVRAGGPEAPREFSTMGEYMRAVVATAQPNARHDPRLDYAPEHMQPQAAQSMGVGSEGGFLVPRFVADRLAALRVETSIIRPAANVYAADATFPDAGLDVPALNQGTGSNIFGGVNVSWIDEGQEKPETDVKFRMVELQPKEVAATIYATDKSLRNSPNLADLLGERLLAAIIAAEDFQFFRGNGVGKPRGMLDAPGRVAVARTAANQIQFADVVNMAARILRDQASTPIWLYSQAALPQLAQLRDPAGNLIWLASTRDGEPDRIMGLPAVMLNRAPVLGQTGDIGLYDRAQYSIKDGFGPVIEASKHPQFTRNRTVIKAFWNVDGAPSVNSPVVEENGYSVSPYVVLNA